MGGRLSPTLVDAHTGGPSSDYRTRKRAHGWEETFGSRLEQGSPGLERGSTEESRDKAKAECGTETILGTEKAATAKETVYWYSESMQPANPERTQRNPRNGRIKRGRTGQAPAT